MSLVLFWKLAASFTQYACTVSNLEKVLSGNRDKEEGGSILHEFQVVFPKKSKWPSKDCYLQNSDCLFATET